MPRTLREKIHNPLTGHATASRYVGASPRGSAARSCGTSQNGFTAARQEQRRERRGSVLTAFGVTALTFMMLMYGLERRHTGFVLAFAVGCALASLYGFLSGAWPFGVVEAIGCLVALHRFRRRPASRP